MGGEHKHKVDFEWGPNRSTTTTLSAASTTTTLTATSSTAAVTITITTIAPIAQIENAARIVADVVVVVPAAAKMMMTEVFMTAPVQREATTCPTEVVAVVLFGEFAAFELAMVVMMMTPAAVMVMMVAPAVMTPLAIDAIASEVTLVQFAVAVHIKVSGMAASEIERTAVTEEHVVTTVIALLVIVSVHHDGEQHTTARQQHQIR